jgi:hypothetical protein
MCLALALLGAVVFGLIAHGHVDIGGSGDRPAGVPGRPHDTWSRRAR